MMFSDLPIEPQAKIATYLDTPSLCFFARTSWHSLRAMQPYLMRRQQQLLHSFTIKLIAPEEGFFCHTSNVIYACGNNSHGQLGLGDTDTCTALSLPQQPIQMRVASRHGEMRLRYSNPCTTLTRLQQQPPGVIRQMVASGAHTLMLTDQGLYACGENAYGQLGVGHTKDCMTFTRLEQQPPGVILQLVAGSAHTLVLTDQGLYVCGDNRYGQLGLEHTRHAEYCETLTRLEQQRPGMILQLAAGFAHTLVLTDQGLYACGRNNYGQLGLGHTSTCKAFTRLPQQPPGAILQLMAGSSHTLVLTDQGLYACGANSYGQLGLGHTQACTTLTRLPQQPLGAILQVVAGDSHTFMLTDQGLYACGDNSYGQLGLGHTKHTECGSLNLQPLTRLTRLLQQPPGVILQVVTSRSHTLVLTDQGLYACGDNRFGQLGLGHTNACTNFTSLDQVPSELRQFHALCRQLNALIRLSQTKSPSPLLPAG